MRVTINGEPREFPAPLPLLQLLETLGLDPRKIALERNLEIVPRSTYPQTEVSDGDELEIVHFIGGGDEKKDAAASADIWEIAGRQYHSRLIVGTGKYKDFEETRDAIAASGAEIVTVAVRRVNISDPKQPITSIRRSTPICPTRLAATTPTRRCVPCAWPARRGAGRSSSWRYWAIRRRSTRT